MLTQNALISMVIRQRFKNNIRNKFIRNFESAKPMVSFNTDSYGNLMITFKLDGQEELKNNLESDNKVPQARM
jgi:hypothetical protein